MGFVMANTGLETLIKTAITNATDFRCMVCSDAGTPTDAQMKSIDFVSDLSSIGLVEVTNVGYSRQDLAGVSVALDEPNSRIAITAVAPVIAEVQAGSAWKRVVYYIEGASDAARPVIGIDTPTAVLSPNGGNISLPVLAIYITDASL